MYCNTRSLAFRFFVCAVFIFLPFSAHSQARGQAQVLTLERALEIALNSNLSVANAELEVESSADDVEAIKTRRLPKLEVGASYRNNLDPQDFFFEQGVWGTYPVIGPIPANDVTIDSLNDNSGMASASLSQPLSQLYKVSLGIEQSVVKQGMADENLRRTRSQLAREVKRDYFDILQLESDLETIDESIRFYRSMGTLVGQYVDQQIALSYQLLEVEALLAQREAQSVLINDRLSVVKQNLNQLLNRDIDTSFSVATLPEHSVQPESLDQALGSALDSRPEIQESRLRIENAELGYAIIKADYIPDVDLRVSYARLYGSEFIPDTDAYIGLRARWEFYDWGRKGHELASQETEIIRARNQLKTTEESTRIDVEKSYKSIASSRQVLEAQRLTVAAATDKLRVLKNQYEQQSVLLQDVLDAETDLSRARTGYTRAVLDVWNAEADLQRAMGDI